MELNSDTERLLKLCSDEGTAAALKLAQDEGLDPIELRNAWRDYALNLYSAGLIDQVVQHLVALREIPMLAVSITNDLLASKNNVEDTRHFVDLLEICGRVSEHLPQRDLEILSVMVEALKKQSKIDEAHISELKRQGRFNPLKRG